jgi:hypothetical protein
MESPRDEYQAKTGEYFEDYVEAQAPTRQYVEWLEEELVKARRELDRLR